MQILGVGENAPTTERDAPAASRPTHNDLIAKVIATTVIAKLTQGPQSMTPAITAIAKRGANDLPNTSPVCDRNVFSRRPRVRSFPLRFIFTVQCIGSRKEPPAPPGWNLESAPQIPFAQNYILQESSPLLAELTGHWANWLPAPSDTIYTVMRLYWPKETPPPILPPGEATWQPPVIRAAN